MAVRGSDPSRTGSAAGIFPFLTDESRRIEGAQILRTAGPPGLRLRPSPPIVGAMAAGLSTADAAARLEAAGPNELVREEPASPLKLLVGQLASPVVWLLIAACVVSALLREVADAIAILAIVAANALVGFFQEYRAERALLALRSLTSPRARVKRDGRPAVVPAREVVPGDILLLDAGDLVAADAKIIEAHALTMNEALLTGESTPVEKSTEPAPAGAPLSERRDTALAGTAVSSGTGVAEVVATGMATELGKVARLLSSAEDSQTPLSKQLARVGQTLLYACIAIVVVVAAMGLIRGAPLLDVFLSAVSLAVAAVPEGLPAIVTIALALGMQRMAARHVLVRKLPAVETLGCATVICTDKTGTLTTGVMAVRELWGNDHRAVLDAAAACSDATLSPDQRTGIGDPTEVAILAAAAERGIQREEIERERPRADVSPFHTERMRMSILRADGTLYMKGAPEVVLALCKSGAEGAEDANLALAERGLRVLAVATGRTGEERDLTLVGLIGLADPPRPEAVEAIARARAAGVRTVMITGDQTKTAHAIARELGIIGAGEPPAGAVHSRATPEDKLRIVRSWKARGDVVAMTGDGVNDAPALREAHIGIAMGKGGTEVAREASDMVLTDDNFASIVAAVQEGRGVFDNIQKALVYLLAGNVAELSVMLIAAIVGLPLPLLPIQLLWINLATDGLPALALVVDPLSPDVLVRPPRRASEPILGRSEWTWIALTGAVQTAAALGIFAWAVGSRSVEEARGLGFSALVFGQVFLSLACRSPTRVLSEVGLLSNPALLAVVAVSSLVQIGIHYVPAMRSLLHVAPSSPGTLALTVLIGLIPASAVEAAKLARRALARRAAPG